MRRTASLIAYALILAGSIWLGGCAGCEPNPCNDPCEPNACNEPNAPNTCNPNPCGGGGQYGMTPTQPTLRDGGSGWR